MKNKYAEQISEPQDSVDYQPTCLECGSEDVMYWWKDGKKQEPMDRCEECNENSYTEEYPSGGMLEPYDIVNDR